MAHKTDKLLNGPKGIAEHFGLPVRSVQHMIETHGMPVIRIGRRIYGRIDTIKDWLASKETSDG